MKALLLLAAAVIGCTVPATNSTYGFSIEPGAFAGFDCSYVNLTNSAAFLVISANAFSGATGFTDISIPLNTRIIEDCAFSNSTVAHAQFLSPLTIVSELAFDHLRSVAVHCPNYSIRVNSTGDWQNVHRKLAACDMF